MLKFFKPKHSPVFQESLSNWRRDHGDETLKLTFPLTPKSVVFDVGGYKGQWTSDIYAKYRSQIYVFEPVKEFSQFCQTRFKKNPDITIISAGLAATTGQMKISKESDASSVFKQSNSTETIELVSFESVFNKYSLKKIDLIAINIEGGEYELLEAMIDSGLIAKVKHVLVQFHEFVPDAANRRNTIIRQLQKTHIQSFSYPFIWESWHRKK